MPLSRTSFGLVLDRAHGVVLGDLDQVIGAVAAPALAVPGEPAQRRAPQQLVEIALAETLGVAEVGEREKRQPHVAASIGFLRTWRLAARPLPPAAEGFPAMLPFGRIASIRPPLRGARGKRRQKTKTAAGRRRAGPPQPQGRRHRTAAGRGRL
jgi:hypothetical protein